MKKLKEAFNKLQDVYNDVFGEDEVPSETPAEAKEFVDATLEDGTTIRVEGEIATGAKVMVVAEDGSEIDAPDGTLTMSDGRAIVVEAGVITEVIEAEAEPADGEEQSSDEEDNEFSVEEDGWKSLIQRVADLEEANKTFKAEAEKATADKEKADEAFKAMYAVVQQLAKMPEDEEPAASPSAGTFKRNKKGEAASNIAETLRNLKNK